MIRTNLATRPFYNERAVYLWLAVLGAVVIAATAFNVGRIIEYSQSDTELAMRATSEETQSNDLRAKAVRLRATVDPRQIESASVAARQANELIDRRVFSWTELFNQFEITLPDDVRITSVRPVLDPKRGIVLTVTLVARSVEDIDRFMENLEGTGGFTHLVPLDDHPDEDGLIEATIEGVYTADKLQPKGAATKP